MLVAVVVGDGRAIEGGLEIGLRVSAAEEVLPGTHLADRIHGLAILGQVDPREQRVHHAGLVGVHDELLVAHGQATLEPAGGMEHEVHARQTRGQQSVGGFERGLSVGNLGGAQTAAGIDK